MVNQGWAVLNLFKASVGDTAWWMKKSPSKLIYKLIFPTILRSRSVTGPVAWSAVRLDLVCNVSTWKTASTSWRGASLTIRELVWNGNIVGVNLPVEELLAHLLNWRLVVGDSLLRNVLLMLHQELLVCKIRACHRSVRKSSRSWCFAIMETIVFHVDLNFLRFTTWSDEGCRVVVVFSKGLLS